MKYEYVIDEKGFYYVCRPKTSCEGRARNSVFLDKLGVEPTIISPSVWKLMTGRLEVKVLEVK